MLQEEVLGYLGLHCFICEKPPFLESERDHRGKNYPGGGLHLLLGRGNCWRSLLALLLNASQTLSTSYNPQEWIWWAKDLIWGCTIKTLPPTWRAKMVSKQWVKSRVRALVQCQARNITISPGLGCILLPCAWEKAALGTTSPPLLSARSRGWSQSEGFVLLLVILVSKYLSWEIDWQWQILFCA